MHSRCSPRPPHQPDQLLCRRPTSVTRSAVEAEVSDLAHLEKAIVRGPRFSGAKTSAERSGNLGIDISVKSEVNDVVLVERKLLEAFSSRDRQEESCLVSGGRSQWSRLRAGFPAKRLGFVCSGPETARRMVASSVVGGALDIHAATPTYGNRLESPDWRDA